jgi:hypothetical protein
LRNSRMSAFPSSTASISGPCMSIIISTCCSWGMLLEVCCAWYARRALLSSHTDCCIPNMEAKWISFPTYVSYSPPQAPFLPCASSQFTLFTCHKWTPVYTLMYTVSLLWLSNFFCPSFMEWLVTTIQNSLPWCTLWRTRQIESMSTQSSRAISLCISWDTTLALVFLMRRII